MSAGEEMTQMGKVVGKARGFLERIRKKYEEILNEEMNADRELFGAWPLPQMRFMRTRGKQCSQ